MKSQKEPILRKTTADEASLIDNYVYDNFDSSATEIFQQFNYWIKEGKVKEVFALKEDIQKSVEKLPVQVYSAGIPIGSLWGNKFQLEVEGAALLLSTTNKKLKVKTDQFLYGKHVFVENIESLSSEFEKGDMVLIIGRNALHHGIGKAELSSDEIRSAPANTILIKGSRDKPLDRGWYLRKGN